MFYDVHDLLVQAVHKYSSIVIHIYGGKHSTLLFISTLGMQASRSGGCRHEGVMPVRFTINGNWEQRGPQRVHALPERTLPSSLPCQDGGLGLPDVLNSEEDAHIFILHEISRFLNIGT